MIAVVVAGALVTGGCGPYWDYSCVADATCLPPTASTGATGTGTDGSGGSGGDTSSGGTGGTGSTGSGPLCLGDPAEGHVGPDCGVWVRVSQPGDDNNPGTQAKPVRTIAKAIELALAGPKYMGDRLSL
jgi:hypothetical protein